MMPIEVFIDFGPLAGFLGVPVIGCAPGLMQIPEYRVTLKQVNLPVFVGNRRHLRVWVDLFKFRFVLIHLHHSHFLEFKGDLIDLQEDIDCTRWLTRIVTEHNQFIFTFHLIIIIYNGKY
jgi:hypothetical protein